MSVDWYTDPDVVVPPQFAIAVYRNNGGEVCIAQQGQYGDDEDVYITVAKGNALALAQRILEVAGVDLAGPLALPAPQSNTNADRQRRYRERQRTGSNVTTLPLEAAE